MIRNADFNDSERLTELFMQLHRHHVEIKPETFIMPERGWFSGRISEILNDSGQTVIVHESGGVINGYAIVKTTDVNTEDKRPRRMCYVDCFVVSENSRRQGIGTELFNAVKKFGKERGCDTVQLGVNAQNADAVAFYEKMGLKPRTLQMEVRL